MKFTLSWLKDHLDTNATLDDVTTKLNAIGLEVESLHDPAQSLRGFIVAEIIEAVQHPNADRLRVCQVNIGDKIVEVVCGAPNARAGLKTIYAPIGATIPASGTVLKKSAIRGVESNGMLCSGAELQLDTEADGILDLSSGMAGAAASSVIGGDPVIEINLTPNRADCASVRGIARDLSAAGLGTLKPLAKANLRSDFSSPINVTIECEAKLCPIFAGRLIKNVKNSPSPEWMQARLRAVGQKPISFLVDVTNYSTLDLNRPLHVFDADKIKGGLVVRNARAGEILRALNDKDYLLTESMIVIADEAGVQSLAGIMGGRDTACDDNTKNVFLESALWDPINIAQTGRALQLNSDARYRFERGIDPDFVEEGLNSAAYMIVENTGGDVSKFVRDGSMAKEKRHYILRNNRVRTLGGLDLPAAEQKEILQKLGCEVHERGDQMEVTVPSWRPDLLGEADLVEEILRIHGFDHIPEVAIPRSTAITQSALDPLQKTTARLRRALAANSFAECVTFSFMERALAENFLAEQFGSTILELSNPISSELSVMRPSVIANLALAATRNADKANHDVSFFEIGPAFAGIDVKDQQIVAAALRAGSISRAWNIKAAPQDVFAIKDDLWHALDAINAPTANLTVTRDAPNYYHPGRSGAVRLGNVAIAYFGELHPRILTQLGTRQPMAAFELFIERLPVQKTKGTARPLLKLPSFQPVKRDFAFIVDQSTDAASLLKAVRNADKQLIVNAEIFDVYQGKGVADGKKSLAISVTLQPLEKTLTDADIEAVSQKIIAAAQKDLTAELRS